jgi:hypothetical protein
MTARCGSRHSANKREISRGQYAGLVDLELAVIGLDTTWSTNVNGRALGSDRRPPARAHRWGIAVHVHRRPSPIILAALLLMALTAACAKASSPSTAFYLSVANVDGPPVDIVINGSIAAHVSCQLNSDGTAVNIAPGPNIQLPWTVEVRATSGGSMGVWNETGETGPRMILIRGTQAAELPVGAPGGPIPQGSCAS